MRKYFILILSSLILAMGITVYPQDSQAAYQYSENLIPNMTTNTSPSGVASSNMELSHGYSSAYTAFDGNFLNTRDSAWTSYEIAGWLRYDFSNPVVVSQYIIYSQSTATSRAPKNWTFEGSNDGTTWIVIDSQSEVTSWVDGTPKKFTFSNSSSYKNYRINITANNGDKNYTSIGELQMMSMTSTPTPETSGSRAILTITMTNGLEKEYDLSMDEVNAFISWYDAKDAGNGTAKYKFIKNWNRGPFKARSEYVIFDKILTFSVDEYDLLTP